MARPIKDTPELFGQDAERFENIISNTQVVSKSEKGSPRAHATVAKALPKHSKALPKH